MQILLTLNTGLGVNMGPNFNLTANVGSVSPSTATKTELLAGKLVTIDDTATQITVTSVGTCTTSLNISVSGITTTTTTLSPASFILGHDNINFFTACTRYTSAPQTFYSTNGSSLIVGTTLYDDAGLTTISSNGFYSNGTTWWRITLGDGVISNTGSCATTSTTSTSTSTTSTSTSTSTTTEAPTTTTTSTTAGPEVFSLGYHATVGWQSCYTTRTTYYGYTGDIIQNGTSIFTDITLSAKAPVGYYSDGANYYYVASTCNEYTFTNNLGYDESVDYFDCTGSPQTLLVYDGTTSSVFCVDSIVNLNGLTANLLGLGSCTPNSLGTLQDATPCPTTTTTSTTSTSTSTTSTSTTSTSTTSTSTTTTTTAAPTTTTTTSGGGGTTSTTTTLSYTPFSLTYSNTAGETACTDYATPTNRNVYYAGPGATLGTGTVLYTTSALTTPVANGYYSNGANYWNTAANAGNLQNQTVCAGVTSSTTSTTTTTTQPPTTTTSTSTSTSTTTTAAPVNFKYSTASANDACTGGLTMTSVTLDNTGLCNSTTISCNEFASEIAGVTVWISYAGDVREATINNPNTTGEATFTAACVSCSATTTTAAPTTTSTTTTTTAPPPSTPTIDTCGGTATFAIVNNATGVNVGYTIPTDGSNSFLTCTLTGSPLSPGTSDSFIGNFGPSYTTEISGAGGKQLRTWVGSTLFSTITLTGTSTFISGDASFGSSVVILEVVD